MEREMKAPLTREAVEGIRRGCCQPVYRPEELIDQLAQSHELLRARLNAAEQENKRLVTALDAAMRSRTDPAPPMTAAARPTRQKARHYTMADVVAEMKYRAEQGCDGDHETTCLDADDERHPEDWCDRCLMSSVVTAVDETEEWAKRFRAALDPLPASPKE